MYPQPYVTELDLRHSLIPEELIEDLLQSMPKHQGPDLLEDRDLEKYDYVTFMENMTIGKNAKSGSEATNGAHVDNLRPGSYSSQGSQD